MSASLAVMAVALLAGCAGSPPAHLARSGLTSADRGAAAAHGAPAQAPSPSGSTAALSRSKPEAPPEVQSAPLPAYPYPVDAGGQVVSGQLQVSLATTGPSGAAALLVSVPAGGWIATQAVFIYLGNRYVATLPEPGTSREIQLPPSTVGKITVSGFQFPGDSPDAPIDGFGTAAVAAPG
jgi:hypothetical protein